MKKLILAVLVSAMALPLMAADQYAAPQQKMKAPVKLRQADISQQKALLEAQAWLKAVGYDRTIEQMQAMTWLRLQKYSIEMVQLITDDNLRHLKVLTNLEQLTLPRQIGDAGMANIVGLHKLRDLNIYDSKITDASMGYIKNLKDMQKLIISANDIGDAGVAQLAGLTNVTILNLSSTKISDAGIHHLTSMSGLQKLFLFRTNITDAAVPDLLKFKHLDRLNIQATGITPAGYQQLQAAMPGVEINY